MHAYLYFVKFHHMHICQEGSKTARQMSFRKTFIVYNVMWHLNALHNLFYASIFYAE